MKPSTVQDHDPEVGLIALCPCHTGDGEFRLWPENEGPGPLLAERHGKAEHARLAAWCDHTYRLTDSRTGEWIYVAEPYQLHEEAFEDFVFLGENGWRVEVTAWRARHSPGHTVAVLIRRENAQ
ncbi:hypothetical protein [Amycolatopsis echigonensis]|uniref:Uncharacterized protein n=1 Tax=Amycolatopsis echigonensis TaxID=2576905 RepID=A0A2N3WE57_9PSEU|nr:MULTISPECIES: hypothetical protein [Amycolatopsis]MBB2499669.1 hypothetical protein [Amycolatopsis echigonensis]PKV92172.1 hypothetical protein ATK30_2967 [Amycolatopsis niigatensis]